MWRELKLRSSNFSKPALRSFNLSTQYKNKYKFLFGYVSAVEKLISAKIQKLNRITRLHVKELNSFNLSTVKLLDSFNENHCLCDLQFETRFYCVPYILLIKDYLKCRLATIERLQYFHLMVTYFK